MKRKIWVASLGGAALLTGLSFPLTAYYNLTAAQAATRALFGQINDACLGYRAEYETFPESFENVALARILAGDNPRKIPFTEFSKKHLNANNELVDSWGTPIQITVQEDQTLSFVSAGKDKIFQTPDDVRELP
jgi:hypothetical protein